MAHFIGNDKVTFDSEKIIIIHWDCIDQHGLTYAEVHLIGDKTAWLYFTYDDDFDLINDLRNTFGYDPLPRAC